MGTDMKNIILHGLLSIGICVGLGGMFWLFMEASRLKPEPERPCPPPNTSRPVRCFVARAPQVQATRILPADKKPRPIAR